MGDTDRCPICRWACRRVSVPNFHSIGRYFCSNCGEFLVHVHHVNTQLQHEQGLKDLYRLSAILKEQAIRDLPPILLLFESGDCPALVGTFAAETVPLLRSRWPSTVPERLDRVLANLGRLQKDDPGTPLNMAKLTSSVLFARDSIEGTWYIRALEKQSKVTVGSPGAAGGVQLTPKGWERFADLTRGGSSERNPAFVAMWFGEDDETRSAMKSAYDDGILPGVEDAGYHATRVDLEEHNEYIMDKILADILVAPFLVADFTGHRNGVYYEAGIARGRGIPVVNCCRRDSFKEAHFDTKQLNHIVWETPQKLRERLAYRILGTIGRGPYTDE